MNQNFTIKTTTGYSVNYHSLEVVSQQVCKKENGLKSLFFKYHLDNQIQKIKQNKKIEKDEKKILKWFKSPGQPD